MGKDTIRKEERTVKKRVKGGRSRGRGRGKSRRSRRCGGSVDRGMRRVRVEKEGGERGWRDGGMEGEGVKKEGKG